MLSSFSDIKTNILDIRQIYFIWFSSQHYDSVSILTQSSDETRIRSWSKIPKEKLWYDEYFFYDLNEVLYPKTWIALSQFDCVIYAEVIEHLFCLRESTLAFSGQSLSDNGFLICQTPNGASLEKRIRMLFGHPTFDRTTAGYYREFSKDELIQARNHVGLECVTHIYKNYSGVNGGRYRKIIEKILHYICFLEPNLR